LVQWHLGFVTEDYTPYRRGFDSHYGYYSGCEDYYDHTYAGLWPDTVSVTADKFTVSQRNCVPQRNRTAMT